MKKSNNYFLRFGLIRLIAISFTVFMWFFMPNAVFATAEIFFEPDRNTAQEDYFKVSVFLNTNEPLNAIEGILRFPPDLLEFQSADDGNSIVNFWVERPSVANNGEIRFSGITPGGYKGEQGLIFSTTFRVLKEGEGILDAFGVRILQNDGYGTEAEVKITRALFAVVSKNIIAFQVPVSEIEDDNPPESFAPEIARDADIFDGKWFLVFSTQDKTTGIDHYEVKETRWKIFKMFSPWIRSESPHVLNDQELKSVIFVKAVDKAGNSKVETVLARSLIRWYENYENWLIITLSLAVVLFVLKKFWKKFL